MALTQAEKFKALGLVRTSETVSEDDIPEDTVTLANFTVNLSADPSLLLNDATFDITNSLSQQITETCIIKANGNIVDKQTVTLAADETKTITMYFLTSEFGNVTFTVEVGATSNSVTKRVS